MSEYGVFASENVPGLSAAASETVDIQGINIKDKGRSGQ